MTTTATPAATQQTEAEREAADRQALIDSLKAQNPGRELRQATHPSLPDWIIFKVPNRAEFRIYRQMQADPAKKAGASQMLLDTCVVWPVKAEFDRQLDAHPALEEVWVGEILEGSGSTLSATQKKL